MWFRGVGRSKFKTKTKKRKKKTKKEGKKQSRDRSGFFFLTVGNYRLIRAVGWEKITMSSEVGEVYSG